MRVLFFGTPEWAATSLRALIASRHPVVGVVTAADAPIGRSRVPSAPAVKQVALAAGLSPILQPTSLRPRAVRAAILDTKPDLLVVVAYGRMLPGELLDHPRYGAINLHFSLLPRHRGASPVQHALLAGDTHTGVTTMQMDRGLDTGPIWLQSELAIEPDDTTRVLGARLADLGASLLVETLDRLEQGGLSPTRQDEARATLTRLLQKSDGWVHWSESAEQLCRRIRAFDPWPAVIARGPKGELRLCRASVIVAAPRSPQEPEPPPGTVLARHGDAVYVSAGGGTLMQLERVKPAGGRELDAAAALSGGYLVLGGKLEDGGP